MADSNDQHAWAAPPPSSVPGPANSGPSAAPPPPEVKVRTLASDLESMARSGGGAAQFQNVAVPMSHGGGINTGTHDTKGVWTVVAVIVAIGLIAAIGYFSYELFLAPKTAPSSAPAAPPIIP